MATAPAEAGPAPAAPAGQAAQAPLPGAAPPYGYPPQGAWPQYYMPPPPMGGPPMSPYPMPYGGAPQVIVVQSPTGAQSGPLSPVSSLSSFFMPGGQAVPAAAPTSGSGQGKAGAPGGQAMPADAPASGSGQGEAGAPGGASTAAGGEANGEAAVEWESTPYSLKLEGELRAHRTNNEKLLHELSTCETQVIKLKAALIERDNQVAALQAKLETLNGMSPTRRPPVQLSERPREPLSPAEAVSRAMDSPIVSFPSNRSRPADYSTGRNLTFATDRSPASPAGAFAGPSPGPSSASPKSGSPSMARMRRISVLEKGSLSNRLKTVSDTSVHDMAPAASSKWSPGGSSTRTPGVYKSIFADAAPASSGFRSARGASPGAPSSVARRGSITPVYSPLLGSTA